MIQSAELPVDPTSRTSADKPNRTPLSLRFRLLVGVNATLTVLLTFALIADYRRELAHHLRHEKAALVAEAETIAAALPALQPFDADSIQRLLDAVLAGMNSTDAPRHRILVEWNGLIIEPKRTPGLAERPWPFQKPILSADSTEAGRSLGEIQNFVVGTSSKNGFTVRVAEPVATLRREIGFETIERLLVLVIAGLVAMGVVYVILLHALVRPIEDLCRTVEAIGGGELGTQAREYRTAELSVLAKSINSLSTTLAEIDEERRRQMSKARKLQQHLLAPWPTIGGLTFERRFLPATDVTGDYHEAYSLGNGEWLFCIADVTGHGIPAAMTASMLKILFNQAAEQIREPHMILQYLNKHLGSVVIPGDFATMLIVHWIPQQEQIHYANAGHEPGVLIRSQGEMILLESDGFMVGAVPDARWNLHCVPVSEGDRLFMYTDGAVETFNSKRELFGRSRLHQGVVRMSRLTPKDAVEDIIRQLDEFRGNRHFSDDITLILMQFQTPPVAAIAQLP